MAACMAGKEKREKERNTSWYYATVVLVQCISLVKSSATRLYANVQHYKGYGIELSLTEYCSNCFPLQESVTQLVMVYLLVYIRCTKSIVVSGVAVFICAHTVTFPFLSQWHKPFQ